jgi:hypothetical protein
MLCDTFRILLCQSLELITGSFIEHLVCDIIINPWIIVMRANHTQLASLPLFFSKLWLFKAWATIIAITKVSTTSTRSTRAVGATSTIAVAGTL